MAVNDFGINRLRLEINAGNENSVDWWTKYINGEIAYAYYDNNGTRTCPPPGDNTPYWRYVRGSTVDDNDTTIIPGIPSDRSQRNPVNANLNGFKFAQFDEKIEKVVLPFKQKMEASGKKLLLNLEYVGFHRQVCSPYTYDVHTSAPEYAEFMTTTVAHMKNKYNLLPDVIEPILEPDNTDYFNGTYIAKVIIETDNLLQARGLTKPDGSKIKFIAPSNTNMANAIYYYDAMVTELVRQGFTPGNIIEEFVYHRYGGVSDTNLQSIASRAKRDGINTSMLEHIGSNHQDLHKDLKIANNSSWQQYTLAFLYDPYADGSYFSVPDETHPTASVEFSQMSKYIRQYFKYILPGAKRISATYTGCTNNNASCSGLDPLAFINPGGKYVVVIKSDQTSQFRLTNIPNGTYGITHTIGSGTGQWGIDQPDITVTSNNSPVISIPGIGVITIYAKSSTSPSPTSAASPTPLSIVGDLDHDGDVDIFDYNVLVQHFNTTNCTYNLTGSCLVDIFDYNLLIQNFGN